MLAFAEHSMYWTLIFSAHWPAIASPIKVNLYLIFYLLFLLLVLAETSFTLSLKYIPFSLELTLWSSKSHLFPMRKMGGDTIIAASGDISSSPWKSGQDWALAQPNLPARSSKTYSCLKDFFNVPLRVSNRRCVRNRVDEYITVDSSLRAVILIVHRCVCILYRGT